MKHISKEKMQQMVNKMVKKMMEQEKKEIDFILNNQSNCLEKLYQYFQTQTQITNDDTDGPIDDFAFNTIFTYFHSYAVNECNIFDDPEIPFSNENFFVQYKDQIWKFSSIYGQGTLRIIEVCKETTQNTIISVKDIELFYKIRIELFRAIRKIVDMAINTITMNEPIEPDSNHQMGMNQSIDQLHKTIMNFIQERER